MVQTETQLARDAHRGTTGLSRGGGYTGGVGRHAQAIHMSSAGKLWGGGRRDRGETEARKSSVKRKETEGGCKIVGGETREDDDREEG